MDECEPRSTRKQQAGKGESALAGASAQQFAATRPFTEGFAIVADVIDGTTKWGFVDKSGSTVIKPQFYKVKDFREGLAPFQRTYLWGFVDRTGKEVVAPKLYGASTFSNGLAAVQVDRYWGYMDKTGRVRIGARFAKAGDFSREGVAAVKLPLHQVGVGSAHGDEGDYLYINTNGQAIWQRKMK